MAVLDRLGVLDEVRALGSPPLVHSYIYHDGAATPTVAPTQRGGTAGYALSVRRAPLDALLVRRATAFPSVELATRTRFVGVIREDDHVIGAELMTPDGPKVVRARMVIGADGRQSAVARSVGATAEFEHPPIRALYHRYVSGFPGPNGGAPDGAEFSFLGDELAYVFPSDAGVTCIALSVNLVDFARARSAGVDYFNTRLAAHRGLAARYVEARAESKQLGCGPEPNYVRVPGGPGWALVGDAGLHQDPWAGQGMDLAGTHAAFLADALIEWFAGNTSEEQALNTYHERRNAHALPLYHHTVTMGQDLRQPVAS